MHAMLVAVRSTAGALLALTAFAAAAQNGPLTTENIGRDPGAIRQEAEQQRSRDMQQQQQRSQDQAAQQYNDIVRQQQSRAAADAAQGEAVRRTWAQRPPLAPDHNPLLGRWNSLGAGQRNGNPTGLPPEMAQLANALVGNLVSGVCDSMLGRGTIEFRPNGVVAIGRDGSERPMYRAEYRGGGSRVVVLPQAASFTHMIIDFNGSDHATVAQVGCALARAGGGAKPMAVAAMSEGASAAPEWALLGSLPSAGGVDVYVARSTIRRSGSLARMTDLFDFKTSRTLEGKTFTSARNQGEYDCAGSRRRTLGTTAYAGHMGQGAVVASDPAPTTWEVVGPSGPLHEIWKVACTSSR